MMIKTKIIMMVIMTIDENYDEGDNCGKEGGLK